MIVTAIADMHGCLPNIEPTEILFIAGDICPDTNTLLQANWLNVVFRDWLDKIPAKHIVGVAGNHDVVFERLAHLVPQGLRWHYLEDQMLDIDGLRIYGMPWISPVSGAFNCQEESLERKYAKVPNVDVIVSHGPPYGIGDLAPRRLYDETKSIEEHCGSLALRNRIFEIQPLLVVVGHIHESRGIYYHGYPNEDSLVIVNASLMNSVFKAVYQPMVFNLNKEVRKVEVL